MGVVTLHILSPLVRISEAATTIASPESYNNGSRDC